MKSITCNKIIIIDAIGKHIDDIEQSSVACALHQSLSDKISELQNHNNKYKYLSCEIYKVSGKEQWNEVFFKIEQECKGGIYPIIHFVSHGEMKGMRIADKSAVKTELIPWSDVFCALTKINIACRNNLFVSMCVCCGFWSMMNLLNRKRIPFCGLLASPDEVSVYEVNALIPNFYISLLENKSFKKAEEKFNQTKEILQRDNLNIHRWYIKLTDIEFVKAAKEDYEKRSTPYRVRQIAKKGFKGVGFRMITEQMIRSFMGVNFKSVPKIYQEHKDILFMRDLYPEEYNRFDLPSTYDELRRCSLPKEDMNELYLIIDK